MRIFFNFHVKKPKRISVRVFMQRLEQMNIYLPYLPCLKDSDIATPETDRMDQPFSQYESELGVIVLSTCPSADT